MDSDSDSDDSMLDLITAFPTKRKRTEEKKVSKGFSILDEALDHADQMKEHDTRIAKIKQDNKSINEKELMAKIEQTVADAKAAPPKSNKTNSDDREAMIAGIWEDLENVLGKERCLLLGKARDTEVSSTLGSRRILLFDPSRTTPVYFDCPTSNTNNNNHNKPIKTAHYIRQLKEILRKHVSPGNKRLQMAWIQPLRQRSRNPTDFKFFLEQRQLAKLRQDHQLLHIPHDILLWLLRVACSTDSNVEDGVMIRDGAMETLLALLRQNKAFQNDSETETTTAAAAAADTFQPDCFSLSQMVVQLQSWVPLAETKSTTTKKKEEEKQPREDSSTNAMHDDNNDISSANPRGFERFLILWNTAFEMDQVSTSQNEAAAAKDATSCLVLLTKAGLDVSVQSTQCHFRLMKHLKCLVSKLLEFVKHTIFQTDNEEKLFVEWMKETAQAIVDELERSDLGPGEEGTEDSDDEEGWLCFALACRMLPTTGRSNKHKNDYRFQKSAAQFKSILCLQILQHFFLSNNNNDGNHDNQKETNITDTPQTWEEEAYAIVQRCEEQSKSGNNLAEKTRGSLHWLVLCSALAALVKINELRGAVQQEPAKTLATAEIALGSCMEVGMELFRETDDVETKLANPIHTKNEYKTAEEAKDVASLLGLIRLQCTHLAARMNSSMMSPHLSRVGYLVQCHVKYFMDTLNKAAYLGGDKAVVQKSLDGWLRKDMTGIKTEDCSDDEGDDNDQASESSAKHEASERPAKKQRMSFSDNKSPSLVNGLQC